MQWLALIPLAPVYNIEINTRREVTPNAEKQRYFKVVAQIAAKCPDRVGSSRSCFAGEQVTAEPFELAQDSGRCKLGMRIANLRLAKPAHTEAGSRLR